MSLLYKKCNQAPPAHTLSHTRTHTQWDTRWGGQHARRPWGPAHATHACTPTPTPGPACRYPWFIDRFEALLLAERILSGGHRTADPARADWFWVPAALRVLWTFDQFAGLYNVLSQSWPMWNATGGARHVLMDNGERRFRRPCATLPRGHCHMHGGAQSLLAVDLSLVPSFERWPCWDTGMEGGASPLPVPARPIQATGPSASAASGSSRTTPTSPSLCTGAA